MDTQDKLNFYFKGPLLQKWMFSSFSPSSRNVLMFVFGLQYIRVHICIFHQFIVAYNTRLNVIKGLPNFASNKVKQ